MSCKGICIRHKAASNNYANGQKRCQICEMFIKWDDLSCPCCGYRLRNGPRSFKFKTKLRILKQIERQKQKAQMKNSSNIVLYAQ